MDELIKRLKELIEEEETVGKVTFEFKENDPENCNLMDAIRNISFIDS